MPRYFILMVENASKGDYVMKENIKKLWKYINDTFDQEELCDAFAEFQFDVINTDCFAYIFIFIKIVFFHLFHPIK